MYGINLFISKINYPQMDGAAEIMNILVDSFMRSYCRDIYEYLDHLISRSAFAYSY